MAIAINQLIPDTPDGAIRHPTIKNACAMADGTVLTYDPRLKTPEWYVSKGILNTHGRRQSQIAKKMRLHYQIVYECFTQTTPEYHSKNGEGMTIDHIDGDKDNNAFSNLRLVSLRDNVRSASCKSGMPYAVRLRDNGTFRVVLRVLGKMTHLGTFKTLAEAVARRDAHLKEISNAA